MKSSCCLATPRKSTAPRKASYNYKSFKDAPAMPYRPEDRKINPQSDQLYLLTDEDKQDQEARR